MKKDVTIGNDLILPSDHLYKCEYGSRYCYWKTLDVAKVKCNEWKKCGMIKGTDKEPPTLSGIPIYWAVKSTATVTDTKPFNGDNVWIRGITETLVPTTTPTTDTTGRIILNRFDLVIAVIIRC